MCELLDSQKPMEKFWKKNNFFLKERRTEFEKEVCKYRFLDALLSITLLLGKKTQLNQISMMEGRIVLFSLPWEKNKNIDIL